MSRAICWGRAVLAAALFFCVVDANAVLVLPGQTVPAVLSEAPVGNVLSSASSHFSSGSFSGALTSTVIAGDTDNPFVGSGGLTFTYALTLDNTSTATVRQFSVGSFGAFQTDIIKWRPDATQILPYYFERSNELVDVGNLVTFEYWTGDLLSAGQTSALLIVRTDARYWGAGSATINHDQSLNGPVLGPVAVPEPGTWALLLASLGTIRFLRRNKPQRP